MSLYPAVLLCAAFVPMYPSWIFAAPSGAPSRDDLATRSVSARAVLNYTLIGEKNWVGIHAAEVLVALGEGEAMRNYFVGGLARTDASPYRIGAWRVLARVARSAEERASWVARIEAVLLDPAASDRGAALESLAKLEHRFTGPALQVVTRMAEEATDSEVLIPLWALQLAGDPEALPRILRLLTSSDLVARRRAGYVLRWLQIREPAVLAALARAADAEAAGTDTYAYLLSAALWLQADPARMAAWRTALEQVLAQGSVSARFETAHALAPGFTAAGLPLLDKMLEEPEGDVRIGAAWIILSLQRNSPAS